MAHLIGNLLIHAIDVKRPSITKDSMGGQVETLATIYSAVPCMIQPASDGDKVLYAQRQTTITHSVYMNTRPTLQMQDILLFGSRKFRFKGMRDACEMGLVQCIDCEEMP